MSDGATWRGKTRVSFADMLRSVPPAELVDHQSTDRNGEELCSMRPGADAAAVLEAAAVGSHAYVRVLYYDQARSHDGAACSMHPERVAAESEFINYIAGRIAGKDKGNTCMLFIGDGTCGTPVLFHEPVPRSSLALCSGVDTDTQTASATTCTLCARRDTGTGARRSAQASCQSRPQPASRSASGQAQAARWQQEQQQGSQRQLGPQRSAAPRNVVSCASKIRGRSAAVDAGPQQDQAGLRRRSSATVA